MVIRVNRVTKLDLAAINGAAVQSMIGFPIGRCPTGRTFDSRLQYPEAISNRRGACDGARSQ